MRIFVLCFLLTAGVCAQSAGTGMRARRHSPTRFHGATAAAMSAPKVSAITETGFTVSWTTTRPLNTQLNYGVGSPNQQVLIGTLTTSHTATVTGLQAGTKYSIQAESSYYTQVELQGPGQTVTTQSPPPASGQPPSSGRLFPSPSADWLYSAPTGTGLDISNITGTMKFDLNTHDGGFDYPVQYTDGTHGCTNFTDTLQYDYTDHYCAPNPANGYHPSVGGWGYNDGHVVVVDTATRMYYDFWKLYVDGNGKPTSTNVGGIASGSLDGNGTPGHTASKITGLAGDILPGELDCATCLNHALNCVVPGTMNSPDIGHQSPAYHTDGTVKGAIFREGAKLRLDPSLNISTLKASVAVQALMRALQLYGAVITDQSGSPDHIGCYTALAQQPDTTGINLIPPHLLIYY